MKKVWNVIQGLIVTGASIGIVSLAVNQALTPKPVVVTESKQVQDDDSAKPVEPVKRESRKVCQLDPQSLAVQSVGVLIGSPPLIAGK